MSYLNTYKQGLKAGQLMQIESKIKDNEWDLKFLTKEKYRLEHELKTLIKEEQDEVKTLIKEEQDEVCVDFEEKEIDENFDKLKAEEQNAK